MESTSPRELSVHFANWIGQPLVWDELIIVSCNIEVADRVQSIILRRPGSVSLHLSMAG